MGWSDETEALIEGHQRCSPKANAQRIRVDLLATKKNRWLVMGWRHSCGASLENSSVGPKPQFSRLFVAVLVLFGTVSCYQTSSAENYEYKVASAKNQWVVDIDKINCLSIADKKTRVFGQDYSGDPRIAALLHRTFPTKAIERENPSCPFVYGAALAKYNLHAPTMGGKYPSFLISVAVCERTASGEINPNRCSSKNVYLFQTEVEPFAALELGMKAFVRPQENEWEVFNIGTGSRL